MRKIQILGAFIAIIAFSALAVSSASATLWLKNGASLTKETAAGSHGTIILEHVAGLSGNYSLTCTGLFVGTNGPELLDLVTEVTGLTGEKNLVLCEVTAFQQSLFKCVSALKETVTVHALELPWHTLLELSGGKTFDRFLHVKWEFLCPNGTTGNCKGEELAAFKANGTNGPIFEFEKLLLTKECSDGGEATASGLGEGLGGYTIS